MMENAEDGLPGFAPFSLPSHSPGCSQSDPPELQNNVSLPHWCPQSKHPTPCKVYKDLHSPAPAYFSNHLSLYSNPIPPPSHFEMLPTLPQSQLKIFTKYMVRGYKFDQGNLVYTGTTVYSCRGCVLHNPRTCYSHNRMSDTIVQNTYHKIIML